MNGKVDSAIEEFIKEKSFEFGELLHGLNVPRADCVKHSPIGFSTIYVVCGWNRAYEKR